MALTAATSALIAAGLAATSSISQGQAAKQQAKFQSAVQDQQAARERQISASSEDDFRRQQFALLAERRAAMGKSGVEGNTGTPLLAASDFAAETELQARRIRAGGETQATRLEQQAGLTRRAGKNDQQQGFLRAGSSLLSGYSDWKELKK